MYDWATLFHNGSEQFYKTDVESRNLADLFAQDNAGLVTAARSTLEFVINSCKIQRLVLQIHFHELGNSCRICEVYKKE